MRIAVIDIAASIGGAKSILIEFYSYLVESKDENEWYFFLSEKLVEKRENIHVLLMPEVKKNWFCRLSFDLSGAKKIIEKISPDVILNFQNTAINVKNIPQYMYLQQSIPFQTVKRFSYCKKEEFIYAVYQNIIGFLIKRSLKKAAGVIVQTEWMKAAISRFVASEKIFILAPAITVSETNVALKPKNNVFFYPASGAYYKNHKIVVEAAKLMIDRGIEDFKVIFTLDEDAVTEDLPGQFECVGLLPREIVMENYHHMVLVFPSYIETYGMPLAEARLSGGVILAAKTSFSEELLEGYENAYYFDAFDAKTLEKLMEASILGKLSYRIPARQDLDQNSSWKDVVEMIVRGKKYEKQKNYFL